jgi:uncharacterized protein YqjF (DUF2071 family)
MPAGRWLMAQRWNNLAFLHWPVATDEVRARVPSVLELDLHANTAWLSITPFYLSDMRAHGTPAVPWLSEFPELNVRTYVTLDGKPGVFFFSLDAGSVLAVNGARMLFDLPYQYATMSAHTEPNGAIAYQSSRGDGTGTVAEFDAVYAPTGPVQLAPPGSLDHWLSERYCLYAVDPRAHVYRMEIHHWQWPLQPMRIEVRRNTMATAAGLTLPPIPPRTSFARSLDVVIWNRERVR